MVKGAPFFVSNTLEKQLTYLYGVAQGTNSNYPLNAIKDIEPYYSPEIDKHQKRFC